MFWSPYLTLFILFSNLQKPWGKVRGGLGVRCMPVRKLDFLGPPRKRQRVATVFTTVTFVIAVREIKIQWLGSFINP